MNESFQEADKKNYLYNLVIVKSYTWGNHVDFRVQIFHSHKSKTATYT